MHHRNQKTNCDHHSLLILWWLWSPFVVGRILAKLSNQGAALGEKFAASTEMVVGMMIMIMMKIDTMISWYKAPWKTSGVGVVAGRVWTWTRGRAVFHPQMLPGPGLKGFFSSHFLMERQKKTFTNVKAKKKHLLMGRQMVHLSLLRNGQWRDFWRRWPDLQHWIASHLV